jgi:hypothetical protein
LSGFSQLGIQESAAMPVVDIKLNVSLPETTIQALATEFAAALGSSFEKTCPRVMVSVEHGPLFVDGSAAPAAWVVVRSAKDLGIEDKRRLCRDFFTILNRRCPIDPARVFVFLTRVAAEDTWNMTSSGPCCVADRIATERAAGKPAVETASAQNA